jgi:hypothetical protein
MVKEAQAQVHSVDIGRQRSVVTKVLCRNPHNSISVWTGGCVL